MKDWDEKTYKEKMQEANLLMKAGRKDLAQILMHWADVEQRNAGKPVWWDPNV